MPKHKIEITGGAHPVPVVSFEDEKYALAATFLLAEARSFGREILRALDGVCAGRETGGAFSGNVFSLEIAPDKTVIVDDISGAECEMETRALQKIAEAYCAACRAMEDGQAARKK